MPIGQKQRIYRLDDLEVTEVSLVDVPANQRKFLFFKNAQHLHDLVRDLSALLEAAGNDSQTIQAAAALCQKHLAREQQTSDTEADAEGQGDSSASRAPAAKRTGGGWAYDMNSDHIEVGNLEVSKSTAKPTAKREWRPTMDLASDGSDVISFGPDAGYTPPRDRTQQEKDDDAAWGVHDLALAMQDPRFDVGGSLNFETPPSRRK